MSELSNVAATVERFAADFVDPAAGSAPVSPAVVGAVFAAMVPVLEPAATGPDFACAVERATRDRFVGPVCLLWEPIEEILNLVRPGHVWQFGAEAESAVGVPAQLPRTETAMKPAKL